MLLSLGALVEETVDAAARAVESGDLVAAERVRVDNHRIDAMEVDVEEECLHTLALHQPVAFDLRFLVAVLKINNDLERIGDLAGNMADRARELIDAGETPLLPTDLTRMARRVRTMLKKALDALVNIDPALAREVQQMDDEIDEIHRGMFDEVIDGMKRHPENTAGYIRMLGISRQLERIGDHAVNIAEDVLYMVRGEVARHREDR